MEKMNIPQLLKSRRLELDISQQRLAEYIGYRHRSSVHRLETGELEWKMKDFIKACEILRFKVEISKLGETKCYYTS